MTTEPETTPAAQPAEEEVQNFADQLQRLLDKLVPPDEVQITLANGEKLTLPGAISARRQIKVFRLMRTLLEMPQIQQGLQANAGTAGVIELIIGLATDEEVAEMLGSMFREAYPDALPDGEDPLDALPLEELAVALVPFSERFVQRLGKGMMVLTTVANP